MDTIQIRPYDAADFDEISRIHDAARRIELAHAALDEAFLPFTVASDREDFFDYPHIDVAVVGGRIAAFSAYTDEELAWLYVDPAITRRKIGTALIRHALQTEPGICAIEVLTGNEPAKQLYESMGFRVQRIIEGVMPGNETFPVKVYAMERCR